jgi:hypothetical protein
VSNGQYGRPLLPLLGRAAVIVVDRMRVPVSVAVVAVLVLADVEVEVKKTCTELAVTMPVVGGVQAQACHAHGRSQHDQWSQATY